MVLAQLCPTRMRLLLDPDASIFSFLDMPSPHRPLYGHGGGGGGGGMGSPMANLSRFAALVVFGVCYEIGVLCTLLRRRHSRSHMYSQNDRSPAGSGAGWGGWSGQGRHHVS